MNIKQFNFRFAALFLLSAALIGYELAVMRTFSVGSWSNFGSMVISIALLGFGLAGTLLTFLQKQIKKSPNKWLSILSLLFMPAMALAHVLAQHVPFNPVMITSDSMQYVWIGVYYLIYAIPFFIGAVFINVCFVVLSSRIYKLYFWNMTGSGLGGLFILLSMYIFPPDKLIIPLLFLAFLTSLFCYIRYHAEENRYGIAPGALASTLGIFCISFLLIVFFGKINVSEFKGISYAHQLQGVVPEKPDYYSYSPTGEMHVYSSPMFHFAPGLSDNAALNLEQMPVDAFKGLYIDGGGPIGIMKALKGEEARYIDFLPMTAPYLLIKEPRVLLIKLGGGISTFTALHHQARQVVILESNPDIINMMGKVPALREYNDNLLANPKVQVLHTEPRAYCSQIKKQTVENILNQDPQIMKNQAFDLVEISLIDSVGLSQAGGYPIDENYTYTVEAITDYMNSLNPQGMLSITVWNKLKYPRNVPKLLTTIVAALEKQQITHPEKRIFLFDLYLSTATVLVKNTDFTVQEVDTLKEFCRKMSFNTCYYPGMPEKKTEFVGILNYYTNQLTAQTADDSNVSAGNQPGNIPASGTSIFHDKRNLLFPPTEAEIVNSDGSITARGEEATRAFIPYPNDLYHHAMYWLLAGKEQEFYNRYIFDIRPATDDRPYYTAYLKPQTLGAVADKIGEISEEWGYLVLLGTLLQSILFGFLIILIPLLGRWKELFKGQKGTGGIILYYACLGLAYMIIEIFLIQRLSYFLADPIFSTSIVITSMLILSALGSLFSSRFNKTRRTSLVRLATGMIALTVLFYIFGLSPLINSFIGLPLLVKSLLAIIFIAPAAFFMGMPYPNGLSALEENRTGLIPWALGMNGALSVTGSMIAKLGSVSFGFSLTLGLAAVLYILAGVVFPANNGRTAK